MTEIQAPNRPTGRRPAVFLAGSIEMNEASQWQRALMRMLPDEWEFLNPRRDDWDETWVQDPPSDGFREQVRWEIEMLEYADVIPIYFDPHTKSSITLLEFGKYVGSGKVIVCSPPGFWRRGNLIVECEVEGIPLLETLPELADALKERLAPGPELNTIEKMLLNEGKRISAVASVRRRLGLGVLDAYRLAEAHEKLTTRRSVEAGALDTHPHPVWKDDDWPSRYGRRVVE